MAQPDDYHVWFMDIPQCLGISLGVYRSLPDAFCMIDDFQALPMIPGRLLALFAFHLFVMDTISFFQTFCPTLSFSIYCLKDEISLSKLMKRMRGWITT